MLMAPIDVCSVPGLQRGASVERIIRNNWEKFLDQNNDFIQWRLMVRIEILCPVLCSGVITLKTIISIRMR